MISIPSAPRRGFDKQQEYGLARPDLVTLSELLQPHLNAVDECAVRASEIANDPPVAVLSQHAVRARERTIGQADSAGGVAAECHFPGVQGQHFARHGTGERDKSQPIGSHFEHHRALRGCLPLRPAFRSGSILSRAAGSDTESTGPAAEPRAQTRFALSTMPQQDDRSKINPHRAPRSVHATGPLQPCASP
jgi:hypothetical protein